MAWRERCDRIVDTLNNLAEVVGRQAEAMRAMGENMRASQERETSAPTPPSALVATVVPYKQFMAMNPPSFDEKSSPLSSRGLDTGDRADLPCVAGQ